MPKIEKLKVVFELDASILTKVLMEQNSGFTIEAYQPAAEPMSARFRKDLKENMPPLLEDHSKHSLRMLVLTRLRYTGKPTPLTDLQALAANNNFDPGKPLWNLMWSLCQKGLVRRTSQGVYKITPVGMKG